MEEKINLPFEILYNTEFFDKWTLGYLKKAGLRRIQVGIQTGSKKESKNVYNRDLSIEKIKRFAHTAKRMKLDVVYEVILDDPLADFEDKKSIIDLLLSLPRSFSIFIYSLTIFPGTELSELLLKQGLISDKDIEGQVTKSFHQFRLNCSYPRSREESFIISLAPLTSKFLYLRS